MAAILQATGGFEDFLDEAVRRQEQKKERDERPVWYHGRKVFVVVYYVFGCIFYCLGPEQMSILRAVYFITVSTTTIGFGDVVPTSRSGKVFTMLWILFGLGFVLPTVSDTAHDFIALVEKRLTIWIMPKNEIEDEERRSSVSIRVRLTLSLGLILIPLLIAAIFFLVIEAYHSHSDFDSVDAFYLSLVMITTVGYGDIEPSRTRKAQTFIVCFVPFAVIFCAAAIHNLSNINKEVRRQAKEKQILARFDMQTIRELDPDGRGINRPTYILAMLISMEAVDLDKLQWYSSVFDEHDKDKSGLLDKDDLLILEQEHAAALNSSSKSEDCHSSHHTQEEEKQDMTSSLESSVTPLEKKRRHTTSLCFFKGQKQKPRRDKEDDDVGSQRRKESIRAIIDKRPLFHNSNTTTTTNHASPLSSNEHQPHPSGHENTLITLTTNPSPVDVQYISKRKRPSFFNLPSTIFSESRAQQERHHRLHSNTSPRKSLVPPPADTTTDHDLFYDQPQDCMTMPCIGHDDVLQYQAMRHTASFSTDDLDDDMTRKINKEPDRPDSPPGTYPEDPYTETLQEEEADDLRPRVLSLQIVVADDFINNSFSDDMLEDVDSARV